MRKILTALILALSVLLPQAAQAVEIPAPGVLVDQADVLSVDEELALVSSIQNERTRSGTQLAVLIVQNLDNVAIEDYAIEVARQWGVGREDLDNGALVLVAIDERLVRIEVGRGLEGALTDIESGRIIDKRISPEFKNGNYALGLQSGVDGIVLAIADEYDPIALTDEPSTSDSAGAFMPVIFFGIFLLQWFVAILARSKSWWAGGVTGVGIGSLVSLSDSVSFAPPVIIIGLLGLGVDYLVSKNYQVARKSGKKPSWWAGGTTTSRGKSSGSGGPKFGGGGFGGGGATGGW